MRKNKKLIAILLTVLLLFNVTVSPASANPVALPLVATGAGILVAGSAYVAQEATPVLSMIVASGVEFVSVQSMALATMLAYSMFTVDAQNEIQQYANAESYILSEKVASEFKAIFAKLFGSGASYYTFSGTDLLVYDYFAQRVFSNTLTSTIYNTTLAEGSVNAINSSLSVSIVSSPFTDGEKAVKIINSVTGAELIVKSTLLNSCEYSTFKISEPVINPSANVANAVGFWILSECSEQCSDCIRTYNSEYIGDPHNSAGLASVGFQFMNTGYKLLDNRYITQFIVSANGLYNYVFNGALDGSTTWSTTVTPTQSICSTVPASLAVDTAIPVVAAGDIVYVPTADICANADSITREAVTTGEFTRTGTGDTGIISGVLGTIVDLLKAIPEAIGAVLSKLFIPSDGFLEELMYKLMSTMENRFGLLTYPLSLLIEFFTELMSIDSNTPAVFVWGSWDYEGTELIKSGSFNLTEFIESNTMLKYLHELYMLCINFAVVVAFLRLCERKFRGVMNN